MSRIIELTDFQASNKMMLNIDNIVNISDLGGSCRMFFTYSGEPWQVKETYEEIKAKIENCGNIDNADNDDCEEWEKLGFVKVGNALVSVDSIKNIDMSFVGKALVRTNITDTAILCDCTVSELLQSMARARKSLVL